MKLSQVNESLNHAITGGGEYGWKCWGNARTLDYETSDGHVSVVYSPRNQEVYEATAENKNSEKHPYRWLNPAHKDKFIEENKTRGFDPDEAWDGVKWIDLESGEDFLSKARAISEGEEFDRRVQVPLMLSESETLQLCMLAHARDITLNAMVELVLTEAINHKEGTE